MSVHELEYKRLLSELTFRNEELGYIEDSMQDIHVAFELYYSEFLEENNLTKQELEESKTKKFQDFKKEMETKMPETDETGIVVVEQKTDEYLEAKSTFSKMYKKIVMKCHPDKLNIDDDIEHFHKMNTMFKAATYAYDKGKWSKLIKIGKELGIKPSNYKKANGHLRREVKEVNGKIDKHKSTFGWKLYQAEEKDDKDKVVKDFIFTLFRRKV